MSVQLPPIGRGTITLRRLYGSQNKGDIKVSSTASFVAGMVAKRQLDSYGNVELAVCDVGEVPAGLFGVHKITSFYQPVIQEAVAFVAGSATANLAHANVSEYTVYYYNTSAGTYTQITTSGNWSMAATNGVLTRVTSGWFGPNTAAATAYVSYRYEDTTLSGIDETLGSGKATIWEGAGEFETLVYDTSNTISLGDGLYCNTDGLLTSVNVGGTKMGLVTRPPTASNPSMRFKLFDDF